jgi:hypothetical protein
MVESEKEGWDLGIPDVDVKDVEDLLNKYAGEGEEPEHITASQKRDAELFSMIESMNKKIEEIEKRLDKIEKK